MGAQRDLGRMTKGSDKSMNRMENKASARASDVEKGHQPEKVSSIEYVGTTSSHHGNMGRGVRFKLPEESQVADHSVVTRSKLGA